VGEEQFKVSCTKWEKHDASFFSRKSFVERNMQSISVFQNFVVLMQSI